MKTKFALITFMAAAFMTLSITPVHAGKVALGNLSKQNAYAMRVTFTLLGDNTVLSCALPGGSHAGIIEDAARAVSKIVVYKTDSCVSGTPGGQVGSVLKEYNVPTNQVTITNSYGVEVSENGSIEIKPYQF